MASQKTSYRLMNGRTVAGTSHTYHALCVYSGKPQKFLLQYQKLSFVILQSYIFQPYNFHPFSLPLLTNLPISPFFCVLWDVFLLPCFYPVAFTALWLHTQHLSLHAPPSAGSSASNPLLPSKAPEPTRSLCLVSFIKCVGN